MDKLFQVKTIAFTPNPQQLSWLAMHQDYSEEYVGDRIEKAPDESRAGELVIEKCLKFGHWGVVEHPQISLSVGYFPHSTMQQLRTHRTGISFDCQSFRYTGNRLYRVGKLFTNDAYVPGNWVYSDAIRKEVEGVVYLRPIGDYTDRNGAKYTYTEKMRLNDLALASHTLFHYVRNIDKGVSEEHARSVIPFDTRQHFVVSCNLRSLIHILNLRWKKDAQLECQQFCELAFQELEKWCPEIAAFVKEKNQKTRPVA